MSEPVVLIIDDSPSIRETLGFLLRRENYEVHSAVDGTEGLEAIRELRPDAVLLDAMMPGLDGFEVCRRVKQDAALASTHIIMLTAMGQSIDENRAREAGVDCFLTKPPDIRQTLNALRDACGS